MKLKSMTVTNFQSHKESTIEFHEGVNVIVGNSDSGKTALMRALYWTLFNKPAGADFRSDWGGSTEVHLGFEDGHIARIRNEKFNGYQLGEESYKGFGQGMPEPIERFVNLDPVNFQSQHDPPFLLSWSPGERGAYINRVANLENMDKAIANIQKIARNEIHQISSIEESVKQLKKERDTYDYLPQMETDLILIENKEARRAQLHQKIEQLEELSRNLRWIDGQVEQLAVVLEMDSPVLTIEILVEELAETSKAGRAIQQLLDSIGDENSRIVEYRKRAVLAPQVAELFRLLYSEKDVKKEYEGMEQLLRYLYSNKNTILTLKQQLRREEEQLHILMPDICPLCGGRALK